MPPIRRILVVVDPSLLHSPALNRAEALAQALKAQLWLALYDRGPRLGALGLMDRAEAHRIEDLMRAQESTRLGELRERVALKLAAPVRLIDDHERLSAARLTEHVREHQIELVLKDVGHESSLRKLVFLPLDWELLRACPVPLWMVGSSAADLPKRIVAAVDPVHPEHGAGALNEQLLALSCSLRDAASADLRVYSAYPGLPAGLDGLDPMGMSPGYSNDELYERLRVEHRDALDALMRARGLPGDSAVVLYGPPAFSLLDAFETDRPDLLVVGTLRRHGLERLLLGSTVERLIGEAPCDILAVPAAPPASGRGTP